jgi:hypothetical protein
MTIVSSTNSLICSIVRSKWITSFRARLTVEKLSLCRHFRDVYYNMTTAPLQSSKEDDDGLHRVVRNELRLPHTVLGAKNVESQLFLGLCRNGGLMRLLRSCTQTKAVVLRSKGRETFLLFREKLPSQGAP